MPYGKVISIYLKDGMAAGFATVELANWNGKAIKIPRSELTSYNNRDDLRMVGIYFLFGKNDNDDDVVYIGESENVFKRLVEHLRDYRQGKEKFYWSTAIAFVSPSLDKALIRYLEYKLFEAAKKSGTYEVLTKNIYRSTKVSESQVASMEEFMGNVRLIVSILGHRVLDVSDQATSADVVFNCVRNNSNATCFISKNGVTVQKDSVISDHETPSFAKHNYKKLRDKLIQNGVIVERVFTRDYEFDSPSAAAAVVIGNSANGRTKWRDSSGKTIGDYL